MKIMGFKSRVEGLSKKLKDTNAGCLVHLDFDSFSEPEKLLFAKVDEIKEKYIRTGSVDDLAENAELVFKELEVVFRRVRELYCYVAPKVLGLDRNREIVEHFFRLHFYNFEADLAECLEHVDTLSEKEREEFLLDLRKNGVNLFRFTRGFDDYDHKNG
jgi:hypothetical protein